MATPRIQPVRSSPSLPVLYPILDVDCALLSGCPSPEARRPLLERFVQELAAAGVTLLQYRNKRDPDSVFLDDALAIRAAAPALRLILNDRVALVSAANAYGVHVGQSDMPPAHVRARLGPGVFIGLSTNTPEEVAAADLEPVDSIAVGPVFATTSKSDTDPIVGLEGVRRARALTRKPLVAIGGISLATATSVLAAGADSLAVISALFGPGSSPGQSAEAFFAISK